MILVPFTLNIECKALLENIDPTAFTEANATT